MQTLAESGMPRQIGLMLGSTRQGAMRFRPA
jgi:hypothetical protein